MTVSRGHPPHGAGTRGPLPVRGDGRGGSVCTRCGWGPEVTVRPTSSTIHSPPGGITLGTHLTLTSGRLWLPHSGQTRGCPAALRAGAWACVGPRQHGVTKRRGAKLGGAIPVDCTCEQVSRLQVTAPPGLLPQKCCQGVSGEQSTSYAPGPRARGQNSQGKKGGSHVDRGLNELHQSRQLKVLR